MGELGQSVAMTASDFLLLQAEGSDLVAAARVLFREYADAIATDLEYQGFSAELAALPAPYVPPSGALLIALAGDQVAGCVALRPLDSHIGEMKRLYVRPPYRGSGLGLRLVQAVVQSARRARYGELRLDTLPSMSAAQALYVRLGFVEIPAYNQPHLPGTRFYALKLAASKPEPRRGSQAPRGRCRIGGRRFD
jgi:putative acetyltransferase